MLSDSNSTCIIYNIQRKGVLFEYKILDKSQGCWTYNEILLKVMEAAIMKMHKVL